MTPFFQILMGDQDVTARVGQGNLSLTITDAVGLNSDTVQFEIDDADGIIAPPQTGVDLVVIGGYREGPQRNFGSFTVDSVKLTGWPMQISVNAQSVGAKTEAKQPRSTSYKKPAFKSYGDLLSAIAKRNGLKLAIAPDIAKKPLGYEAQAEEDDFEFMTRLGEKRGFALSIKNKNLVVSLQGKGTSVGGLALPEISIVGGVNVLSYSVERNDKPKYRKAKATWFDRDAAETRDIDEKSSSDGPDLLLRTPYRDEDEARDAARSAAEERRRAAGSASFEIVGDPTARAEAIAVVSGIRSRVDGRWRATTVSHSFSGSDAYSTSIECELPEAGDEG